jgi:hypothetical protein
MSGNQSLTEKVKRSRGYSQLNGQLLNEPLSHIDNVLPTIPQRRDIESQHVDPVKQVFAKIVFGGQLGKIPMGRANETHIDALGDDRTDLSNFPFL